MQKHNYNIKKKSYKTILLTFVSCLDWCNRDIILTICYKNKEMNNNERKRTKNMRVKKYISLILLMKERYSI